MTMRSGLDADEARRAISGIFGGDVIEIAENPEGGWNVTVDGVERQGSMLLPEHDHFLYCRIAIRNDRDGDHADYVETIMQTRAATATSDGLILECLYTRRMGDGAMLGLVEGRLIMASANEWTAAHRAALAGHADRTLREAEQELHYVSHAYQYAFGVTPEGMTGNDATLRSMSTIARALLQGEGNAA